RAASFLCLLRVPANMDPCSARLLGTVWCLRKRRVPPRALVITGSFLPRCSSRRLVRHNPMLLLHTKTALPTLGVASNQEGRANVTQDSSIGAILRALRDERGLPKRASPKPPPFTSTPSA